MNPASIFAEKKWRFRPRGAGRFVEAAFLSVWLCGWFVGEIFALVMIVTGLYSLLTGQPAPGAAEPLRLGPALAVGAFLLVWLTIWTIGGVLAIREWLRAVWSEDCLRLDHDGLTRTRRLGPFTSRQHWPRAAMLRVFVQPHGSHCETLMLQAGADVAALTDLGDLAQRRAAAEELRAALHLPADDAPHGPAALPSDWEELMDARGARVLAPNQRTRRQQAWIVSVIAVVVWTGVTLLAWESYRRDPNLWVVTLMVGVFAAWLARQAVWLHRGRKEWRLERGKIVQQRRYGEVVTELAESRALELIEETDGDGDRWYELRAVELTPPAFAQNVRADKIPSHRKIQRAMHDPAEARCLGLWIAQRTGIALRDQVPDDAARRAEFQRVRDELAKSGKFGALVARLLDRVAGKKNDAGKQR